MSSLSRSISIFGSYKARSGSEEYETAYAIARELAKSGYTIINGGGGGIMQASTLGAKEGGGTAVGIVLRYLVTERNSLNDSIRSCDTLFERLNSLINESIGYVIFSGGTGTLTELCLVWELMNKGLLSKRPIICYGDYWKPVVNRLKDEASYDGGLCTKYIKFAYSSDEVVEMIKKIGTV